MSKTTTTRNMEATTVIMGERVIGSSMYFLKF
jgi:hypothetical protein